MYIYIYDILKLVWQPVQVSIRLSVVVVVVVVTLMVVVVVAATAAAAAVLVLCCCCCCCCCCWWWYWCCCCWWLRLRWLRRYDDYGDDNFYYYYWNPRPVMVSRCSFITLYVLHMSNGQMRIAKSWKDKPWKQRGPGDFSCTMLATTS